MEKKFFEKGKQTITMEIELPFSDRATEYFRSAVPFALKLQKLIDRK
jgi:hypothetical protein